MTKRPIAKLFTLTALMAMCSASGGNAQTIPETQAVAPLNAAAAPLNFGWQIGVQNPVLDPGTLQTRITVSSTIDNTAYAFAAGQFDLLFNVVGGGNLGGSWSMNRLLAPLDVDTTGAGSVAAGRINTIRPGQIHFPAAGLFANPANPIPAWEITFTATDFTPRTIQLQTASSRFDVYQSRTTATSVTVPVGMEGMGMFQVVPEPSSLALLGLGTVVLLGLRRWRQVKS